MKSLLAISLCTLFTLVTCPHVNSLSRHRPLTPTPSPPPTPCNLICSPDTYPDADCKTCVPNLFIESQQTNTEVKQILTANTCPVRFCPHGWVWSIPCARCVPNNLTINNPNGGFPPLQPKQRYPIQCNGPTCPPGWIWSVSCGKCVANQFQPIGPIPKIADLNKITKPILFCGMKCPDGFAPNPACTLCFANTLAPSFP